ncbi:MAG: UvrB/UvrC motif-containing protein [Candidatus Omnitrophota bacterium]
MVCDICGKKQASVHLTEIINDQMTELHLCEECAREKGVAGLGQPFALQDLLSGLVDLAVPAGKPGRKQVIKCPNCKLTYEDFKRIGRFGCSECYTTFKQSLEPLFKRIHGASQHAGKSPTKSGPEFKVRKELQDMQIRLQKAIQTEAFEEAAKIRDKIKEMEKKENK